jgi:hypothetical protein
MIVKPNESGVSNTQNLENSIFQVPCTVKLFNLTPKKNLNDYSQILNESKLRKSFSRYKDFSNSRKSAFSPLLFDIPSTLGTQTCQKISQFTHYLKNYVKKPKINFSPVIKLNNPIKAPDYFKNTAPVRKTASSYKSQRHQIQKRGRPARFLSHEDIENHLGPYRERIPKYQQNKQDMKILMENNHSVQLKSLEAEKICAAYKKSCKKSIIVKKNDWTWESPPSTPRYVQFKDLD